MRGNPTPNKSAAPKIRNTTMVTTLIIANQYSNVPKFFTLMVLAYKIPTEKPAIHTHDGSPGNQYLQYIDPATTSLPITNTRHIQYV